MSSSILDIHNLSVGFSGRPPVEAVRSVSMSVPRGKTLALVGESGSGKTATALSIMRLLPAAGKITGGEILFHEEGKSVNLLSIPEKQFRNWRGNTIAMVFQEPMTALNPVFSCGFQVAEALGAHRSISRAEAKEEALNLFERVKLPDPLRIYDSYPHQVSGGQKQRILVAMAISCKPDLLIADEPTTSLDVKAQASVLELLASLQEETGMSMVYISHDLSVVAGFAQEVSVMYKGQLVEHGSVHQIFSVPRHPYTRGLLACRPPTDRRSHTLPVLSDFLRTEADGTVHETGTDASALLASYEVTPGMRQQHLQRIYAQEPLLRVTDLRTWLPVSGSLFGKSRGVVKAVDGITFDVYPGETLGIAGISGCGKTTLARSLPRLAEPTSGQVLFRNQLAGTLEGKSLREFRRQVQLVFQDPYASLNPRMKIGDAILEPIVVHKLLSRKAARDKVMELLVRVGLKEDHFMRTPEAFSGGERQRICIARALAAQPQLLICDESVSALDASVQAQVLNLLNSLKQELRLTCIFISHDLSVVRFMSDRIAVMQDGRFVELGDAEDVWHSPQSEYTRQLLAAVPQGFAAKA